MNHLDYENMIFNREALKPAQLTDLQAHLLVCSACRELTSAWAMVESEMNSAPVIEPAAGFSVRWEIRLEQERQRDHRKQTFAVLGFGLACAFIFLALLAVSLWPVIESPKVYLYASLYQLINIYAFAGALRSILSGLIGSAGGIFPWLAWILVIGVACLLAVVWWTSLRLAIKPRSVTK